MKRLSELRPGQEGKIEKVERLDLACIRRLMVLGFVEGSSVKYVGSAIGGSPIEVLIEGCRISLHKNCASHFFVI